MRVSAEPALPSGTAGLRRIPASLVAALWPDVLAAQSHDYVKANYTKYEYRIPMRDGVRLFTAVYVPKDRSQSYPILLCRTPYGIQPYGVDAYKSDLGPSLAFRHRRLYRGLSGRAGRVDVGGRVRQYATAQGRQERTDRYRRKHDTYDTIDWLIKNVPNHNGKVGMWGISYPRLLHCGGNDRRPPGTQGGLAPGSHRRLVRRRRLAPQRRPILAPCLQLLRVPRASRPEPTKKEPPEQVRLRHTRRLQLLPSLDRCRTPTRGTSRTTFLSGTR